MTKFFINSVLLLTVTFVSYSSSFVPNGITETDLSRAIYQKQQDDLWRIINNKNMRKSDAQDRIYATYKSLTEQNWTARVDENSFPVLKRFYEWNLLEKDILQIQGMWDEFRNFIQTQYVTENFNELAAIDFTDTVFHDKQLTNNVSLENIHLIMVKQNLYYKVALVSSLTKAQCKSINRIFHSNFRRLKTRFAAQSSHLNRCCISCTMFCQLLSSKDTL